MGINKMLEINQELRDKLRVKSIEELIYRNARLENALKRIHLKLVGLSVYDCECRAENEIDPKEQAEECLDVIKEALSR